MLGIPVPTQPMPQPGPTYSNLGGMLQFQSAHQIVQEMQQAALQAQQSPVLTGIAAHVRQCWTMARDAKRDVEKRMEMSLRQRNGQYEPDMLALIKKSGGSEIFMMLTAVKCRAASAWLRDTLLNVREDKPWTLSPTPVAEISPADLEQLRQQAIQQLTDLYVQIGQPLPDSEVRAMLTQMRDEYMAKVQDTARDKVRRMEDKMEDQLVEGGFHKAGSEFIDDLVTFPAAIIKGPVVRKKPRMGWIPGPNGTFTVDYKEDTVLEWERVSPFDIYPSPNSTGVNDGYLIERHRMRRGDLEHLIGVEGYDEAAIRKVLEEYGQGGLMGWLDVDSARANAEGRSTTGTMQNPESTIEALQFWGPVIGQDLLDWGMPPEEVPDATKTYHCEVWLVGTYVIKATLNYHPLGYKPYYKSSYESIPGAFWGNSVADLCRDAQNMCNGAARAIANNMGISSGPQVWVNTQRLPPGEEITQMFPWKIWQGTDGLSNGNGKAIEFFQPNSNVQELMLVFDKFAALSDEYTGIPRYMTGDSPAGGAGRTASGMSMLMNNAGKVIKSVVGGIDTNVLTPLVETLYVWNMKYNPDTELKGDILIVARGAMSITLKEAAQVRRNEFLAATANPYDMSILGVEGRAAVLHEVAKTLDMDPAKVVPSPQKIALKQKMLAMQQAAMPQGQPGGPSAQGQELMNGAPVTDNFGPARMQ
jgi:hypothetical protein